MAAPIHAIRQCFHLSPILHAHGPMLQNLMNIEIVLCRRLFGSRFIQNERGHALIETADGNTIVCYHPTKPFPYEHTKPIPRPDPSKPAESLDSVLKTKFIHSDWKKERRGPNFFELAEMFYTTKHRWFPLGIRRRNRVKRNPPRDRPYL